MSNWNPVFDGVVGRCRYLSRGGILLLGLQCFSQQTQGYMALFVFVSLFVSKEAKTLLLWSRVDCAVKRWLTCFRPRHHNAVSTGGNLIFTSPPMITSKRNDGIVSMRVRCTCIFVILTLLTPYMKKKSRPTENSQNINNLPEGVSEA